MNYLRLKLTAFALTVMGSCSACQHGPQTSVNGDVCTETPAATDLTKEQILVIGDSISIGYTPFVRDALSQYQVTHNPCNAETSVHGLTYVSQWLRLRPQWKLITFNHGMWDVVPFYHVSVATYQASLRAEAQELLTHADKVIFVNTTYAPPGAENRSNADILTYNQAAQQVMGELGIEVVDLYAVSVAIPLSEHLTETDVHYSKAGYETLADAVTQAIEEGITETEQ